MLLLVSFPSKYNDYIATRKPTIKNTHDCIIALLKALRVAPALVVESQLIKLYKSIIK